MAKPAGETSGPGIVDETTADAGKAARQQRVGDDFLQPPAAGDCKQVFLALGLRDLDQIVVAEPGGFGQHRSGDRDFVVPRQATHHGSRRLGNRCKLAAQLGQSDPSADIGDGAKLDGVDQAFKDVAEQLGLLVVETASGRQKQGGHAPGHIRALLRGAGGNRRLDLVGDR